MAEFKVRSKGNADPHGRPRVYFCCHPEDYDRYFDKVCEDIFATHQPAIYYTADMTEPLDETNITVDLGRMNLFLVPVTFRLMNERNRAMQVDIAYAKENNIPILPFMMESGIDEIYSKPENFGEKQYLSPFSTDVTEISYAEKLKKILEAILISDEMATRIRAAFDAYIFLSYRKKDRQYANELMRIIHNIPGCRDIAIWYDEFLTPGESFIENIESAMKKSKLFTLLVTPNLLEYVMHDGKLIPNFVMEKEYPAAKNAKMKILPTEMVETDLDELREKYEEIPDPVLSSDSFFIQTMLSTIERIATSENDNDPEHNFLIGLAYLYGIDVEKDTNRGIDLITMAAEAGLIEAMRKLYDMYRTGDSVDVNYVKALKWAERVVDFCTKEYGEENDDTIIALNNVAHLCGETADYHRAIEIYNKAYDLAKKVLGVEDSNTLIIFNNLAIAYCHIGDYKKSLQYCRISYDRKRKLFGEDNEDTLLSLNNLAYVYFAMKAYHKALELWEKAYDLSKRILGEEHPLTVKQMGNMAISYDKIGKRIKAFNLSKRTYELTYKILGEKHPETIKSLSNLAYSYDRLFYYKKGMLMYKKAVDMSIEILGDEHPDTALYIWNLGASYTRFLKIKKACELFERTYFIRVKKLGENHPSTKQTAYTLIAFYLFTFKFNEAGILFKKLIVID